MSVSTLQRLSTLPIVGYWGKDYKEWQVNQFVTCQVYLGRHSEPHTFGQNGNCICIAITREVKHCGASMTKLCCWQVNASAVYYQITRLSLSTVCHKILTHENSENCHLNAVNSLACMEKYHTTEPFSLPKLLLSLGLVFTHWQAKTASCWLVFFVNTQPGLSCIVPSQIAEESHHAC